ncbi:MAG: metallophosphoesterase [Candidatus Eisenbacteria bacterium]
MRVFALSDLHLSLARPKPMDIFGAWWSDHVRRIETAWRATVGPDDVVCLPGDFSWALKLENVLGELEWLGGLPGRKGLVKGNHDYWWASLAKVRAALPSGIFVLQNDSVTIGDTAFAGARGWVDARLDFAGLCERPEGVAAADRLPSIGEGEEEDRNLYQKELTRLEASLRQINPEARFRVALVHFPPTSPAMEATEVTALLERYHIDAVVFGHLHRAGPTSFTNPYGTRKGITYYLVSADFVGFRPVALSIPGTPAFSAARPEGLSS